MRTTPWSLRATLPLCSILFLVGVMLATPVPAEEPLPPPRVVSNIEPKKTLAVEEFLLPPNEILGEY